MSIVLAALDDSPAAAPVLAVARHLAAVFGASVQGVHVLAEDLAEDAPVPSRLTGTGVPLRVAYGDVVDRLVAAGTADEVEVVAIGACAGPTGARPVGSTAVRVATALARPVAVVPPWADPQARLHRVLVPLEGTGPTSLASRPFIELAPQAGLEVLALHVLQPENLPACTDQPQHEHPAWAGEFLHRHCRWGIGMVRLVTRVGRTEELVPVVAQESGCDLVVLGWARQLASGRAPIVRAVLEQVSVPVLLVPIDVPVGVSAGVPSASAWR
jgi:nucleotide-binding universal stress UspA family protein